MFIANNNGATPVFVAAEFGHDRVIVALARAKASIDQPHSLGRTPLGKAAHMKRETVVRLLAHMGARLLDGDGRAFWSSYQDEDTRERANDFWLRIIDAGGDEPTEESRRLRRRLLVQAGKHDPRDGGPVAEPLE